MPFRISHKFATLDLCDDCSPSNCVRISSFTGTPHLQLASFQNASSALLTAAAEEQENMSHSVMWGPRFGRRKREEREVDKTLLLGALQRTTAFPPITLIPTRRILPIRHIPIPACVEWIFQL